MHRPDSARVFPVLLMRTLRFMLPIAAVLALGSSALQAARAAQIATGRTAPVASQLPQTMDPLVRDVDPSVKPGDDFFMYSSGAWIKENPIPTSEQGWTIANVVDEEIRDQLRGICEASAASGAPAGSSDQKVGDFWLAAMDSATVEAQGVTPLRPQLDQIKRISSRADLVEAIADLHTIGVRPLYDISVSQDDKNSAVYVTFLYQGGIGMPDRDYYFAADSTAGRVRGAYPGHVAAMFRLLGEDAAGAEDAARSVLQIETALAGASRTIEQLRDPYANYHKMSVEQFTRLAPSFALPRQLEGMGFSPIDSLVVCQPEFYARADSLIGAVPLKSWKDYLRWTLINTLADHLSGPFDREDFRFYGTLLGGAPEQRPRWKRVLDTENHSIGDLMGQVWTRKYCSPATKARYEKLVDDIFAAYGNRIRQLPWMSDPTKAKAIEKLARVRKKVGYPDRWRDLSTLSIERDSYARNQIRVNDWWFRYRIGKLGRPVDHTEWDMPPQTYNAYYDGSNNEIVLPAAAFLIPGVPDSLIDDAILYSYAGASTIGHELTHGFDDEGRQYDADGNLKPWWTPQDSTQFALRAQVLQKQFDAYQVGDKHVRGFATLGENIADLGGLVTAYDAFKKTAEWRDGVPLNGLTPDQRFYLGYSLAWLGEMRPELLDQLIMSDVHAPNFLRVNGPLSNIPEFYEAFGIRPGDRMFREEKDRVRIW